MQLKDGVEIPGMDEFWYDITLGGYINPEDLLEDPADARRVRDALEVIMEFEKLLEDALDDEDDEDY
jgi:hypothetical protein